MSNDIGRKLKHLRKSQGMTQEEVASMVQITRSTISNYEIGRRTPHLTDLQKLAAVFRVGLDYFGISGKDSPVDALARAQTVFASPYIPLERKENLYREIMKAYLQAVAE